MRIVRRLGTELEGLTRKTAERAYPPGQAGAAATRRRRRLTEYAIRLQEKQKIRFHYGLTETQTRNAMRRAAAMPGPAGDNLFRLLERRLDNVVFRLGFAPTIPAARQLVRHGHIEVGGRRVSMPAFEVRLGDVVAVREKSRAHPHVVEGVQRGPQLAVPSYLERAADGLSGRVRGEPRRDDVPLKVDETLVVEFYAR